MRQTRFPSWCAGPCGCTGANKTQPDAWQTETNESGAVTGGALSCPDAAVDEVLHPDGTISHSGVVFVL